MLCSGAAELRQLSRRHRQQRHAQLQAGARLLPEVLWYVVTRLEGCIRHVSHADWRGVLGTCHTLTGGAY